MNLTKQGKQGKVLSIIIFIFWLSLIFFFSNQSGEVSGKSSSLVIQFVNSILQLFNSNIDISNYSVTSFIIRKMAHMFLYFSLYLITYYLMYQLKISKRKSLALLFCLFYATTDEIHQLFVNARSGQIVDVGIDMMGALIAYFGVMIRSRLKSAKWQIAAKKNFFWIFVKKLGSIRKIDPFFRG